MIALALIVVAVVVLAVLALRPDPTERICLAVLALRPDPTERICDEHRRNHGGGPFPGGDSRG